MWYILQLSFMSSAIGQQIPAPEADKHDHTLRLLRVLDIQVSTGINMATSKAKKENL